MIPSSSLAETLAKLANPAGIHTDLYDPLALLHNDTKFAAK